MSKIAGRVANSVDPDQTPCSAKLNKSILLHCDVDVSTIA